MSTTGSARDGTPRRTTRRTTATPIREMSPPTRQTRAGSAAAQNTPATRRSGRAASRRLDQPRDVVNNSVLPEVQTQQSYAYGSSKTPLLPEQLHVGDTLTMKQVARQMESAMTRAEQNLDTHITDLEDGRRQGQLQPARQHGTRQRSKDPSPPASETTEVQKKQRTAAWASSLENDPLEDIEEEEQQQIDTPETKRTDPSSFPSGTFDQSYQYERGVRPPRRPPRSIRRSFGSRIDVLLDRLISVSTYIQRTALAFVHAIARWLSRLFKNVSTVILELPDSAIVSLITKGFLVTVLVGFMSYALCFGYTRYLCNPSSTSRISQTIESWCGSCQQAHSFINFTTDGQTGVRELNSALKQVDKKLHIIESRLSSHLDSQVSALHTDIDDLRKEQSSLIQQFEEVSNRPSDHVPAADAASPFVSGVNYFSPSNGAIINPKLTSPTRRAPIALPERLAARMFGIQKYRSHNPITALEPWQDVGDCWCAAATAPGQDITRLGISLKDPIFPTDLVIEHPPKDMSLTPETAPHRVELWADFKDHSTQQWTDLGIDAMTADDENQRNPFGETYKLIGRAEYELAEYHNHIQRFALTVNQYNDLKYSVRDFVVRVRSTHGGEYGCLYRLRLHGVPVKLKNGTGADADAGDNMV